VKQGRIVLNFEVILEPEEEGGYHVYCPLLKGCHSYGATKEEALERIREAIELWLESARELGIKIPEKEVISVEVG
jgi:predicted RNase H-like HicB family nuclease